MDLFDWLRAEYAQQLVNDYYVAENHMAAIETFIGCARAKLATTELAGVTTVGGVSLLLTDGTRLTLTIGPRTAEPPDVSVAITTRRPDPRDRLPDAGAVPITGGDNG